MPSNPTLPCDTIDNCCCDCTRAWLVATIMGHFGSCACANNVEIELLYDAELDHWAGSGTLGTCGESISLTVTCYEELDCEDILKVNGATEYPPDLVSCSPYHGTWSGIEVDCGTIEVVVTER